jgi:hypothetical protein
MVAPFRDYGGATFSTSAAARSATQFMNPLSPGGMNPKGVNIPTLGWALIFVVVAFLVYKFALKK